MGLLIREMEAVIHGTSLARRDSPAAAAVDTRAPDALAPEPQIPEEPWLGALELQDSSAAPRVVGTGSRRREG
jgi:hypothetical protein